MAKIIDLTNKKFFKLLVIKKSDIRGEKNQIKWDCKCDCGRFHTVTGESLRHKKVKSCGCIKSGRPINFVNNRQICLWQKVYSSTIVKRSKKNGYKTNISLEDFIFISSQECNYCGNPHSNSFKDIYVDRKGNHRKISDTIIKFNGIDRIDSSKGYFLDNVTSCCQDCNFSKNIKSKNDFLKHIKKVYEYNFKPQSPQ